MDANLNLVRYTKILVYLILILYSWKGALMAIQNLWVKNFKGTLILKVKMQCDNNVDLQSFVFHSFLENVCTAHNALKYKSSFCK